MLTLFFLLVTAAGSFYLGARYGRSAEQRAIAAIHHGVETVADFEAVVASRIKKFL